MSDLHADTLKKLRILQTQLTIAKDHGVLDEEMLQQLGSLIDLYAEHKESSFDDLRHWLNKLMNFFPQLAPAVDRTLLWTFGGDCLHFLTDEEIDKLQQQEEERWNQS